MRPLLRQPGILAGLGPFLPADRRGAEIALAAAAAIPERGAAPEPISPCGRPEANHDASSGNGKRTTCPRPGAPTSTPAPPPIASGRRGAPAGPPRVPCPAWTRVRRIAWRR